MLQLIEESGYVSDPTSVTSAALEEEFEHHPDLIDAWLIECGDTRSSVYPWLRPPAISKSEKWVVGPCASAAEETWEEFESGPKACASYVKLYLERMKP